MNEDVFAILERDMKENERDKLDYVEVYRNTAYARIVLSQISEDISNMREATV